MMMMTMVNDTLMIMNMIIMIKTTMAMVMIMMMELWDTAARLDINQLVAGRQKLGSLY